MNFSNIHIRTGMPVRLKSHYHMYGIVGAERRVTLNNNKITEEYANVILARGSFVEFVNIKKLVPYVK